MNDLISRQAAIDALLLDPGSEEWQLEAIKNLPSVQLGWTTDVNDILAYLDGVVHPLVSPEKAIAAWNRREGGQDGEG